MLAEGLCCHDDLLGGLLVGYNVVWVTDGADGVIGQLEAGILRHKAGDT